MENVRRQHLESVAGGESTSGEVVRRSPSEVARPEPRRVQAVSQASYVTEKDRYFRAAETLENGGDLAGRATDQVVRLDAKLQGAQASSASPMALATIERINAAYGQGAGLLVNDYMIHPYERW